MKPNHYDVVIVGGSYAGISAAMPLARARRQILVIDGGQRRNRFVEASHGFIGQDGRHPGAIVADAREQLLRYSTVRWQTSTVVQASGENDGFNLVDQDGTTHSARRIILATGVSDELPNIKGVSERWGKSVFICPYCDGYELNQGRIGVLGVNPFSIHQALLLADWGDVTLFTNGLVTPDADELDHLKARGVKVEPVRIRSVEDRATVVLEDGRRMPQAGLFTGTSMRMASSTAEQLGCDIDDGPMGQMIRTDSIKATTVKGVFACGDATVGAKSVPVAVGDGYLAGASTHRSLVFE